METGGTRVLGVDPGTRIAGYGVLDFAPGAAPRVVGCGAIRLPSAPLPRRLAILYAELRDVIETHSPPEVAVETVFHGKSFDSVLKVGEARGVVLLCAALQGAEIHEYTPAMVKKTVTGNGRASKEQVQRMVARLLHLDVARQPVDVADALAIAFCHGQRRWRLRLARRGRRDAERVSSVRTRAASKGGES